MQCIRAVFASIFVASISAIIGRDSRHYSVAKILRHTCTKVTYTRPKSSTGINVVMSISPTAESGTGSLHDVYVTTAAKWGTLLCLEVSNHYYTASIRI